jgi:RNA polymerase sigma-70 factor (ECF subfamily)
MHQSTLSTSTPPSDQELMLAFQHGSVEAFEEIFRRYEQPIWGYFRRRMADAARAEELMQDTFMAVLRGAERYQPTASFRTYLYSIAFNLLSADRRSTRSAASTSVLGAEARRAKAAVAPTLDDDLWMRQAVGRLDELDRAVVMLREFEQLSYSEISEVLHIPVNTVRSRLFRAREALRRLLAPETTLEGHDQ